MTDLGTMKPDRKNLIIVHLESVSNVKLHMYRAQMPAIWKCIRGSLFFPNFHSAATSTSMVLRSVISGDPSSMNYALDFETRITPPPEWPRYRNLARLLQVYGYYTITLHSSPITGIEAREDKKSVFVNNPGITQQLRFARDAIGKCRKEGRPFHLFFWDASSHAAFANTGKNAAGDLEARFAAGYAHIDGSFAEILRIMDDLDCRSDTILAVYGDHGDELWNHGFNHGYCHGTAPYGPQCHTPFAISSPDIPVGIAPNLMSSSDILATMFAILFPELGPLPPKSPFSGLNIFKKERGLAATNNLFPLQREYSDLEKTLTRSYSLTDGRYRFVVSSGGVRPECGGMEFFLELLDPVNSCNLLDFFQLNANGDIEKYVPPGRVECPWFFQLFSNTSIIKITEKFAKLRSMQYKTIKKYEKHVLSHVAVGKVRLFPELPFRQKKPDPRSS
jgi:hypothetical protein